MPCNSDHLNATIIEKEISRVLCLLDELRGIPIDSDHWNGYHPAVYNRSISKSDADRLVQELCRKLQATDVTKYSLEMQMWWRDHKRADEARVRREIESKATEEARAAAIAKLTPHERKLLGIKEDC